MCVCMWRLERGTGDPLELEVLGDFGCLEINFCFQEELQVLFTIESSLWPLN